MTNDERWELSDGTYLSMDESHDNVWWDEDGQRYERDGDDFIPIDPPEELYGASDFRRDAGFR